MSKHQKRQRNQGPPNPIGWKRAAVLEVQALNSGIKEFLQLIALSMIFTCIVGPVVIAAAFMLIKAQSIWLVIAAHLILSATSYVAYVAGTLLLTNGRSNLAVRWPQLRRGIVIPIAIGSILIGTSELMVQQIARETPLMFYAVAGAPLMAVAGHFRSCIHMPQLYVVANHPLDEHSARHLAERAHSRYGRPVAAYMLVLAALGLLLAYYAPVTSILIWLQAVWYTHATMMEAWRPRGCG